MRGNRVWRVVLGLNKTVIEDVDIAEPAGGYGDSVVVVRVHPTRSAKSRCGVCQRKCRGYDQGEGSRRWRSLDLGTIQVFVEAEAPRVRCRDHGVVVAAVPWAKHDAGHTLAFDATVAWLATKCSKTAAMTLMRVAWRTVGAIVDRTWSEIEAMHDRFANVRRIGIDEISYKRHHKYLTVVVDHDTGNLLWAAEGKSKKVLTKFFEELGEERCNQITHVSADGAQWISQVVAKQCPDAVRCADPFHVVAWATDALDEVRRGAWNDARAAAKKEPKLPRGRPATDAPPRPATERAKAIKGCRYALWKNPDNLNDQQQTKLAWVAKTDQRLYRAYLLKEGLRTVFRLPYVQAVIALDRWISWARRCRIPAFVELQQKITRHKASILAAIEHGLSNGRIESMNTKIRLITRIGFGFKSPAALIALAMLSLGGHQPALPGRM